MSTTSTNTRGAGIRTDFLIGGILVVIGFVALMVFANQRQQVLRASPTGLDGLQVWLKSQGEDIQSFTGGWGIHGERIGLLVIPIYDTDLANARTPPRTKEELLLQQDEYDLVLNTINRKRGNFQTLLILPKWRSGVRLTRLAHPILGADPERIETSLNRTTLNRGQEIVYSRQPFTDFAYQTAEGVDLSARLYAAQMFKGTDCRPILGRPEAMVLAECQFGDSRPFFVLSDPDLLNNHGLRLGDNALIAHDFFRSLSGGKTVMIDYSADYWFVEDPSGERPERTWSDLLQFFEYPFLMLWIGGAVALALAIWRAGLRFGAVRAERSSLGHAKLRAVAARARLMRLTRKDGALLGDYASARLSAVAANILGPAYGRDEAGALRHLSRLQPERTAQLEDLLADLKALPPSTTASQTMSTVDAFETLLSEIEHDT